MLCQYLFAGADILSEKNPYFGKHLFAKQGQIARTSFVYKTSVRICLLISALNKRVLLFSSGKLFYKSNRKRFPCVCITVENCPNPSRVYIRLCKHGKRFLLLKQSVISLFLIINRITQTKYCKYREILGSKASLP